MLSDNARAYWKANLRLLIFCLAVWFIVSYGFGILLVVPLDTIKLGGYKLGFWFAQQGSIYTFILGWSHQTLQSGTVAIAFGLAASIFPVLMMGIFSTRMNRSGAIVGMLAGISVTMFYRVSA